MEKGEKAHVFTMVKPLFFSSINITRLGENFKKPYSTAFKKNCIKSKIICKVY
ncbi:MAG: hypothetical protein JWR54_217 [Mucilaginibacter sp.]|nr:hypothetical protein [Mucilaginibacter sp.]